MVLLLLLLTLLLIVTNQITIMYNVSARVLVRIKKVFVFCLTKPSL